MSWVYVLSNPSFPGLFKIGHTTKAAVEMRAAELFSSGLPTPFEIEGKYQVYDSELIEQAVHRILKAQRHQSNREFFIATLVEIDAAISDAVAELDDQIGPKSNPVVSEEERRLRIAEIAGKKKKIQQWGVHLEIRPKLSSSSEGIQVEDCSKVCYEPEDYSPGMDRTLFTIEQFASFKGEMVRLQLSRPLEGRRRFKALLKYIHGHDLLLVEDGQTFRVPFDMIEKARLSPQFDN